MHQSWMDAMRRHTAAATLAVIGTLCTARAQQPPRTVGITPIGPLISLFSKEYFFTEVYFLSNGGANALTIVTDDGAVLIDAKQAGFGSAVLDAMRRVTEAS